MQKFVKNGGSTTNGQQIVSAEIHGHGQLVANGHQNGTYENGASDHQHHHHNHHKFIPVLDDSKDLRLSSIQKAIKRMNSSARRKIHPNSDYNKNRKSRSNSLSETTFNQSASFQDMAHRSAFKQQQEPNLRNNCDLNNSSEATDLKKVEPTSRTNDKNDETSFNNFNQSASSEQIAHLSGFKQNGANSHNYEYRISSGSTDTGRVCNKTDVGAKNFDQSEMTIGLPPLVDDQSSRDHFIDAIRLEFLPTTETDQSGSGYAQSAAADSTNGIQPPMKIIDRSTAAATTLAPSTVVKTSVPNLHIKNGGGSGGDSSSKEMVQYIPRAYAAAKIEDPYFNRDFKCHVYTLSVVAAVFILWALVYFPLVYVFTENS